MDTCNNIVCKAHISLFYMSKLHKNQKYHKNQVIDFKLQRLFFLNVYE